MLRYLLIEVVIKYSLLKSKMAETGSRNGPKIGSLSLLSNINEIPKRQWWSRNMSFVVSQCRDFKFSTPVGHGYLRNG